MLGHVREPSVMSQRAHCWGSWDDLTPTALYVRCETMDGILSATGNTMECPAKLQLSLSSSSAPELNSFLECLDKVLCKPCQHGKQLGKNHLRIRWIRGLEQSNLDFCLLNILLQSVSNYWPFLIPARQLLLPRFTRAAHSFYWHFWSTGVTITSGGKITGRSSFLSFSPTSAPNGKPAVASRFKVCR